MSTMAILRTTVLAFAASSLSAVAEPAIYETPEQAVEAFVPLANMFGYVNQLRSFTQGRANYSMFFDHYDEVPANVATEIKEKLA